jgi:hypothetical protein
VSASYRPTTERRKMMERHTVEITFEAEKVASVTNEVLGTETLYRTPEDTYFVYIDARRNGGQAMLELGHYPDGHTEDNARHMWPELFRLQGRQ